MSANMELEKMAQNINVQSMLKVLDYTKANKKWFDEKELLAGYHTVSILGEKVKGQRDPEMRIAKINYDFAGKRILDVGCSNGGLLHALAGKIGVGVGVDFNSKCINAANALKAINRRDNIHFYTFDLDKEDLAMLRHFIFGEAVDVCFFFNISLWVSRWKEVFSLCSSLTTTVFFESHGDDKQQSEQIDFVKTIYNSVQLLSEQSDDDPTYSKRKMYICENKKLEKEGFDLDEKVNFLQSFDENTVAEAYKSVFIGDEVNTIKFYPNTHESVVVAINDEYIVKLPKPKRGIAGLLAEKSITDFIRGRVAIDIPALSIYLSPVSLVRYRRLEGSTFDKSRYLNLPERSKNALAGQLAQFMFSLHSIPRAEIETAKITLKPSWELKPDLVESRLGDEQDVVVKALLSEVLKNHRALSVPDSNIIFGHFDLHGSNLIFNNELTNITGVIDFGNCKLGDLHQDFSTINLSSPDLAERVIDCYERVSERSVNRLLVWHYTTIFYLNLLSGLKKNDDKFAYWLGELHRWYDYLLEKRAIERLKSRTPATAISSGWRKWIASNLMKGASNTSLQKTLREQGYSHLDIATELRLASEHPYVNAGKEIFHVLNKRNWLLKTCDALAALDPRYSTQVAVIKTPSFDMFIRDYYSKHLPVVLTGGVDNWPALDKWNPEYFLDLYGDKDIEVQFDREQDPLYERNAGKHKKRMSMREFVGMVLDNGDSNNYYMTANNTKNSMSSIASLFEDIDDFGDGYRKKSEGKIDAFLWFGPKGTFTPIHHDLTNNMLVQIYGRKKVTLIPAWQVPWLYNDKGVYSAATFPEFDEDRHSLMKNVTPMEVTIGPGESLFIPIGWWHCVESLDVSISVSFTNFEAPNQFSNDFPRG